eukprot:GILK01004184.1.p2 GENE.GILK01004184.1~~GILK01004184.1.p2  ORF type:complete len:172 (-),score=21.64 GILK01004184.1:549-1064(-)
MVESIALFKHVPTIVRDLVFALKACVVVMMRGKERTALDRLGLLALLHVFLREPVHKPIQVADVFLAIAAPIVLLFSVPATVRVMVRVQLKDVYATHLGSAVTVIKTYHALLIVQTTDCVCMAPATVRTGLQETSVKFPSVLTRNVIIEEIAQPPVVFAKKIGAALTVPEK